MICLHARWRHLLASLGNTLLGLCRKLKPLLPAEVGQLIACMKLFLSFLTPEIASKNDDRHDIVKPRLPKLGNWLHVWSRFLIFWRQKWRQKIVPQTWQHWTIHDFISGIVFWRHVWRQKADKLQTVNWLPNFGKQVLLVIEGIKSFI